MHYSIISLAILSCSLAAPAPDENTSAKPTRMNARVKALFESMRQGTYTEEGFPQLSWEDVPALLELADKTNMLKAIPRSSLSSQHQAECSEGMIALWLVEGIRKGSAFPSLTALCLTKDSKATDWDKESEENHGEAAKAYRAWWKQAQEAGKEKGSKMEPLKGTKMHWY